MATSDDVSELKEEITQLRDGMQSLKTAHAEQQHQMQTREAELTKEVDHLREELRLALKEHGSSSNDTAHSVMVKVRNMQDDISHLQQEFRGHEERLQRLYNRLEDVQGSPSGMRRQLSKNTNDARCSDPWPEVKRFSERVEAAEGKLEQLDDIKEQIESVRAEQNKQLTRLHASAEESEKQAEDFDAIREIRDDFLHRLKRSEQAVKYLRERIDGLQPHSSVDFNRKAGLAKQRPTTASTEMASAGWIERPSSARPSKRIASSARTPSSSRSPFTTVVEPPVEDQEADSNKNMKAEVANDTGIGGSLEELIDNDDQDSQMRNDVDRLRSRVEELERRSEDERLALDGQHHQEVDAGRLEALEERISTLENAKGTHHMDLPGSPGQDALERVKALHMRLEGIENYVQGLQAEKADKCDSARLGDINNARSLAARLIDEQRDEVNRDMASKANVERVEETERAIREARKYFENQLTDEVRKAERHLESQLRQKADKDVVEGLKSRAEDLLKMGGYLHSSHNASPNSHVPALQATPAANQSTEPHCLSCHHTILPAGGRKDTPSSPNESSIPSLRPFPRSEASNTGWSQLAKKRSNAERLRRPNSQSHARPESAYLNRKYDDNIKVRPRTAASFLDS